MKITKEQWAAIEEELKGLFVNVEFEYKGHNLTIAREKESESKTCLVVYIDGKYSSQWMRAEGGRPAIVPEVWKTNSRAYYKPSRVKEIEKSFGKREAKKYFPQLHERYEIQLPFFSKSSVLCRQFKKLDGLTLVKARCLEEDHG